MDEKKVIRLEDKRRAVIDFDSIKEAQDFANDVKGRVAIIYNRFDDLQFNIYRDNVNSEIDVTEIVYNHSNDDYYIYPCSEKGLKEAKDDGVDDDTLDEMESNINQDFIVVTERGFYRNTLPIKTTKVNFDFTHFQLAVIL